MFRFSPLALAPRNIQLKYSLFNSVLFNIRSLDLRNLVTTDQVFSGNKPGNTILQVQRNPWFVENSTPVRAKQKLLTFLSQTLQFYTRFLELFPFLNQLPLGVWNITILLCIFSKAMSIYVLGSFHQVPRGWHSPDGAFFFSSKETL